jgi:hypothetical protein
MVGLDDSAAWFNVYVSIASLKRLSVPDPRRAVFMSAVARLKAQLATRRNVGVGIGVKRGREKNVCRCRCV